MTIPNDSTTRNANILLVEDSPVQAEVIRRVLIGNGHSVTIADNGLEALGCVEAMEFDLVLLDLTLPGMSGVEVLDSMRRRRSPQDLPIIIVTTKVDSKEVVNMLDRGANDYVAKPLDEPVFLSRIQAQLRISSIDQDRDIHGSVTATLDPGSPTPNMSTNPINKDEWIGRVLGKKYRLEAVIGSGGFGVVYRATHVAMNRAVAIKMLFAKPSRLEQIPDHLQHEAEAACRVVHENAVQVFDVDVVSDSVPFIVMELLKGKSLAEELFERGGLPPKRCAEILLPVCHVLDQAHAVGVIHRDIKPGNIFLHQGSQGEVVKVLDFGTAKIGEIIEGGDASKRNTATVRGTFEYLAPERLLDDPYDGKVDVYSLGILAYEMLVGRVPFESKENDVLAISMMQVTETPRPLREINPDIPIDFEAVVTHALEKNPKQRSDVQTFARELAHAVTSGTDELTR